MVLRIKKHSQVDMDDKRLSMFFCAYGICGLFNTTTKLFFSFSATQWEMVSLLFQGMIMIAMLFCLKAMLKRNFILLLLFEIIAVFLYIWSFARGYAQTSTLLSRWFTACCVTIPLGIAVVSVRNVNVLLKYLQKASYVVCAVMLVCFINWGRMANASSYNMSMASYAIVFVLAQWRYVFSGEGRVWDWFVAFVETGFLVILGNRSAALAVIFYIVLYTIKHLDTNRTKIFLAVILVFGAVFLLKFDQIIDATVKMLDDRGMNSYVLKRIQDGNLLESNSREDLLEYYSALVRQRPLLGWGICGGWIDSSMYPHNLFLEQLLSFGVILGGLIDVFLIVAYARALISPVRNNEKREAWIIFTAASITRLVSGGGFLNSPVIFVFAIMSILWKGSFAGKEESLRSAGKAKGKE